MNITSTVDLSDRAIIVALKETIKNTKLNFQAEHTEGLEENGLKITGIKQEQINILEDEVMDIREENI